VLESAVFENQDAIEEVNKLLCSLESVSFFYLAAKEGDYAADVPLTGKLRYIRTTFGPAA